MSFGSHNCDSSNFPSLRFKCLIRIDPEMCSVCYNVGLSASVHRNRHPTQCILTPRLKKLFFADEIQRSFALGTRIPLEHVANIGDQSTSRSTTDNLLLHRQGFSRSWSENFTISRETVSPIEPMVIIMPLMGMGMGIGMGLPAPPYRSATQSPASESALAAETDLRSHGQKYTTDQLTPEHNLDLESILMARRQLELRRFAWRYNRTIRNEAYFNANLQRSLCQKRQEAQLKGTGTQKDLSEEQPTENVAPSADDEVCLLFQQFQAAKPNFAQLKANIFELWKRSDFVQAFLICMLAKDDSKTPVPLEISDNGKYKKYIKRKRSTSVLLFLQTPLPPPIEEECRGEEDDENDEENSGGAIEEDKHCENEL